MTRSDVGGDSAGNGAFGQGRNRTSRIGTNLHAPAPSRYNPVMETTTLSEAAKALFRLHVELMGRIADDDATRDPYRELARAGLMMAGSTFRDGPESTYVLTQAGFDLKYATVPSHAESACAIIDLTHVATI
jgi:hypothetical protein